MEGTVGYRNIRYKCYAEDSHDLDQIDQRSTHIHATQAGSRFMPLRVDAIMPDADRRQ
jgi:hypothetical protein